MSEVRDDHLVPRVFFDEPVSVFIPGEDEPLPGRAMNLSRAGIFVRLNQLMAEVEGAVAVEFTLPDGPVIVADARIIRQVLPEDPLEPAGLALCFTRLAPGCSEPLNQFLTERLEPAAGNTVRLELGELGYPIRAKAHSIWSNVLSVDAELPFLRLGSPVTVPLQDGLGDDQDLRGSIRWVSVHVPPESGVPRINIGIEMQPDDAVDEGDLCVDDEWARWDDEGLDPVCTEEFVHHCHALDTRPRRRVAQS